METISSEKKKKKKKTNGTFEVGLGVVHVVRMVEEKCGNAKTSLDLNNWEKRHFALAYGFEALHCFPNFSSLLVVLREPP